jgi:hypothetical protein
MARREDPRSIAEIARAELTFRLECGQRTCAAIREEGDNVNRNDAKTLDALALAALPEHALIARLANKYLIYSTFDVEQCRAVIRATYPDRGQLGRLADLLWKERIRQEKIHNERKAVQSALAKLREPYTLRLDRRVAGKTAFEAMRREWRRHAHNQFDAFITAAFDTEILALMELTSQDCRSYRVEILDCGIRPAISAVVKVTVEGDKGAFEQGFLLYKVPGTSKVCAVNAGPWNVTVKVAWAWQVPNAAILFAKQGVQGKRTDFDTQEIVLVDRDGDEQRFPWRGKAEE